MKWGTEISRYATPMAGWLGLDCYDPITGDLRPESKCAKTRTGLDEATNIRQFASVIFDRFWSKKGDNTMEEEQEIEYVLQVSVKAVDIKQALERMKDGKVLAVNPRPQAQFGGGQVKPGGLGQTIVRSA